MPICQIRIQAAFELPELTVQLGFPGGVPPHHIDLRDGQFTGELPARPDRLRIVPPLDLDDESAEAELGCDIPPEADLSFQLRLTEHELSISSTGDPAIRPRLTSEIREDFRTAWFMPTLSAP